MPADRTDPQTEGRTVTHGQLTIRFRRDRHHLLVELAGELDLAASDALRAELDAAADHDAGLTVVDLGQLRFVDSSGLGVLFDAAQRADAEDRRIVYTNPSEEVERTLHLTGLDHVLPFDAPAAGLPEPEARRP